MKNLKKWCIIVIVGLMLGMLSACEGKTSAGKGSTDKPSVLADSYTDSGLTLFEAKDDDLTGPWHLDTYRNDLSDFSSLFAGYAEFGATMEIRSNGQISWYIGAEGGCRHLFCQRFSADGGTHRNGGQSIYDNRV